MQKKERHPDMDVSLFLLEVMPETVGLTREQAAVKIIGGEGNCHADKSF